MKTGVLARNLTGESVGVLQNNRDLLLVGLALLHGIILGLWPAWWTIALGLWWNSNTVSHYFIHRPFFTSKGLNRAFRMYQTLLLGVPQRLWRERHLAHHAEKSWQFRWSTELGLEVACIAGLWGVVWAGAPQFFLTQYLPGLAIGLVLCQLQGYFEHRSGTTSHYGWLYNFIFLNDGFHVEHHARPQARWWELPARKDQSARASRWPAVLRWLDVFSLSGLEKALLHSPVLQNWVLRKHERATRRVLNGLEPKRIVIVGGALFPRSAIILRRIYPEAELVVIDQHAEHIQFARKFEQEGIAFECRRFEGERLECDLVVLPLSFEGDLEGAIANQTVPVLVHEWLGKSGSRKEVVSLVLWKQVALRRAEEARQSCSINKEPFVIALGGFVIAASAKGIWLWGRDVVGDWSAPLVYLWQDALGAVLLGICCWVIRLRWLRAILYGCFVLFTALNVPLQKVLSTPFTWNMIGAAQGTLADSVRHHLTGSNVLLIGSVLAVGAIAPAILRVASTGWLRTMSLLLVGLGGFGFLISGRLNTEGLERNALLAFARSAWERTEAMERQGDWRQSPFPTGNAEDLSRFAGMAAGRNVVLIVLESTGAQYLKPWGGTVDPMPNVTRLAEEGVLFENAYAVYPESIKGLFSLLFSTAPAIDLKAEDQLSGRGRSLPGEVRPEYRSGLFHSGRFMYLGMDAIVAAAGYEVTADAGDIGGNINSSFGVDEPATVKAMLQWVDQDRGENPFFLTYLPVAGHHPYDTPLAGPFPSDREETQYLNALHYADQAVGELVGGLRERGLFERTLFVMVGDHGEAFGQHDGNYGHTLALYEENLRVPLLIAAPGIIRSQMRVARTASMIDIAPTILSLIGREIPADWEGVSLLGGEPQMALFFTDYSLQLAGLRDGNFKFIHDLKSGSSKLFDLANDPSEQVNLAGNHAERVKIYAQRVSDWVAGQKYRIKYAERIARSRWPRTRSPG